MFFCLQQKSIIIWQGSFWAAAPKGTMSCTTQGYFLSVRACVRACIPPCQALACTMRHEMECQTRVCSRIPGYDVMRRAVPCSEKNHETK